jgi:hypothetical protein
MAQLIGRVKIIADGQSIDIEKGAKFKLGGTKRSSKTSDGGKTHYSEETEAAELEVKVFPTADCPIETYRNFVGVVLQFTADNGISYQSRNAVTTDCLEITGHESFTLKMAGDPAEKL